MRARVRRPVPQPHRPQPPSCGDLSSPTPGEFALTPVPVGSFYLLAAAFPPGTDTIGQLLPSEAIRVGSAGEQIVVRRDDERIRCSLTLGRPARNAPPVLVALPALLE